MRGGPLIEAGAEAIWSRPGLLGDGKGLQPLHAARCRLAHRRPHGLVAFGEGRASEVVADAWATPARVEAGGSGRPPSITYHRLHGMETRGGVEGLLGAGWPDGRC